MKTFIHNIAPSSGPGRQPVTASRGVAEVSDEAWADLERSVANLKATIDRLQQPGVLAAAVGNATEKALRPLKAELALQKAEMAANEARANNDRDEFAGYDLNSVMESVH